MKLTIKITDESNAFEELMKKTGLRTPGSVINVALTLLDWTADQVEQGNSIAALERYAEYARDVQYTELEMAFMADIRERVSKEQAAHSKAASAGASASASP